MIILVKTTTKKFTKEIKRYRVIEFNDDIYTGTGLTVSVVISVFIDNSIGLFR